MKSALILTIGILASLPAFSQNRGRIELGGGRSTVRVEIGSDRTDQNQNDRIRRLEEAVRDLQIQVYNYRDQPQFKKVHVCSVEGMFKRLYLGKGSTKTEAEVNATRNCLNEDAGCKIKSCEVIEEEIRN